MADDSEHTIEETCCGLTTIDGFLYFQQSCCYLLSGTSSRISDHCLVLAYASAVAAFTFGIRHTFPSITFLETLTT